MVEEGKLLEVSIELTIQTFKFMSFEESDKELKKACISPNNFVKKLAQILEKYNTPHV